MKTDKIIIDTNFLLIPGQFGVDIFEEIQKLALFKYELQILDKTLDELEKIKKEQKGRHRAAADLALKLIKSKGLKITSTVSEGSVDDLIVGMADKDTYVATQDAELKRRLKAKGVKRIILRSKKYLKIEE